MARGRLVTAAPPHLPALPPVPSRDMGGFMLNLILGTVCVSLSLPFGILLALGRRSSLPVIQWLSILFIEVMRGVPLITLIFVANVVLAPGRRDDHHVRLGLYRRGDPRRARRRSARQVEAASPGLDYAQAMRLVVLPRALRISIPGIVNVAVGLFKDTTLVSIISMFDLVGMIRGPILASSDWNGVYWELYGFAALLFFVVCYGISQYSRWLERRLATDHG